MLILFSHSLVVTDYGYHKRDRLSFQLYITPYSYSFLQSTANLVFACSQQIDLPLALQTLFEAANLVFNYYELNTKSAEHQIPSVTEETQHRLAQLTGGQSVNRQWLKYRAGCITSSTINWVCKTNLCHLSNRSDIQRP